MPNRVPIQAAKQIAEQYGCRQVIVLAWDGERTHIVTYGKSREDCSQAAAGGNMLKQKWGWPECNDQPSRVKKLEEELAKLQAWKAEALVAMAENEEWRTKFNDKAAGLGYPGRHYLESACEIADRCVKAEAEVKRLRPFAADMLLEREGKFWYVRLIDAKPGPAELHGPFDSKEECVNDWRGTVIKR